MRSQTGSMPEPGAIPHIPFKKFCKGEYVVWRLFHSFLNHKSFKHIMLNLWWCIQISLFLKRQELAQVSWMTLRKIFYGICLRRNMSLIIRTSLRNRWKSLAVSKKNIRGWLLWYLIVIESRYLAELSAD